MLAPADAELARRDPAIPGMALVLDPEALAGRLRAARPRGGVVSARATYVRYKPGTSCLVGYLLEGPWGSEAALAKAYRRGDGAKLAKARTRSESGDAVSLDDELVAVVGVEGDRDLPLPGRLARPEVRRRILRGLLPGSDDLWGAMPRCLRYKPERRWVGVVERDGRPVALVKGYRRSQVARARAGLTFAGHTPLTVPRLLGTSGRAGALASSWLPGEALSDVLAVARGGALPLAEVGAALAVLHRQPPARLPVRLPGTDAEALDAATAHLGALVPRLLPSAARLGAVLGGQLRAEPVTIGPRHGDFSPDQVVLGSGGAAFIDFDNAAVGDPAADLGHFVAALEAAELDGNLGAGPASLLAADLLTGYQSAGGCAEPHRVTLHTSAALVRLAVEPFRHRRCGWPVSTEALLVRAAALAGEPTDVLA